MLGPCRFRGCKQQVQFLGPDDECIGRALQFLFSFCPLQSVQYLVSIVDAGSSLMITQEGNRIGYRGDDAAVTCIELGREQGFVRFFHTVETGRQAQSSASVQCPRPTARDGGNSIGSWWPCPANFTGILRSNACL